MDTRIKGLIFILLGAFLVLLAGGEFIIRMLVILFGLYLIYLGLELRHSHRVLFFIHRFTDRFSDRF